MARVEGVTAIMEVLGGTPLHTDILAVQRRRRGLLFMVTAGTVVRHFRNIITKVTTATATTITIKVSGDETTVSLTLHNNTHIHNRTLGIITTDIATTATTFPGAQRTWVGEGAYRHL